jgi:hypothetical protein
MKFENDKGQPVEINFQNFEAILRGGQFGLVPVSLKTGEKSGLKRRKKRF